MLGAGLRVTSETTHINKAEPRTIGTTGMNPNTAVPPGVRVNTSVPPSAQITVGAGGAGAGTTAWKIATAATVIATQSVTASAPHFVLPFQNSAEINNGDIAANPENPY